MSLDQWVAVGTLAGNFALVVTLIFVGLQVRQAERNQRAIMQQGRADRISAQTFEVAAHPELARIFNKGMFEPQKLTCEEFDVFLLIGRGLFVSAEDSFLQHKAGMLNKAAHNTQIAGMRRMMAMWPGGRALWPVMSAQYGDDFCKHMDEMVKEAEHKPAPDLFAEWQKLVKADIGAPASQAPPGAAP